MDDSLSYYERVDAITVTSRFAGNKTRTHIEGLVRDGNYAFRPGSHDSSRRDGFHLELTASISMIHEVQHDVPKNN